MSIISWCVHFLSSPTNTSTYQEETSVKVELKSLFFLQQKDIFIVTRLDQLPGPSDNQGPQKLQPVSVFCGHFPHYFFSKTEPWKCH